MVSDFRDFANHSSQDEETRVSTVSRIVDKAISGASCVVIIYGPNLGRQYHMEKDTLSIGRGADNDLVLDLDNVSRMHACVSKDADGIYIEDLGSTNGSYVNDVEVRRDRLRNGDLIKIGGAILKFIQGGNIEALYHEEIYRMTIVDGLTQIHNKRYFLEFLDREMARCSRYERPLTLVMLDVDHFKKVNDTFGHLAGDFVLKRLAEIISKHVRREELFARYGGEEFSIIMPETTAKKAGIFCEKIRRMVETTPFLFEGKTIDVTISLGVAEMQGRFREPLPFIKAADDMLYRAKQNGRNRVEGVPTE
ncbi:MAG: GGDEF domain-containing protein [Deltaproteobacteria bacterium]|nr:GGDEF domain-containing protein [Deltaproteobacteria bacterium]